jgi:hypothetical protein
MDLLADYSASDDDEYVVSAPSSVKVNLCPDVNTTGLTIINDEGKSIVLPLAKTYQYMGAFKQFPSQTPSESFFIRWFGVDGSPSPKTLGTLIVRCATLEARFQRVIHISYLQPVSICFPPLVLFPPNRTDAHLKVKSGRLLTGMHKAKKQSRRRVVCFLLQTQRRR